MYLLQHSEGIILFTFILVKQCHSAAFLLSELKSKVGYHKVKYCMISNIADSKSLLTTTASKFPFSLPYKHSSEAAPSLIRMLSSLSVPLSLSLFSSTFIEGGDMKICLHGVLLTLIFLTP